MESNGMPGGIYSNVQPSMVGLEMSLHHNLPQPQPPNPQNPHHMSQPHPMVAAFAPHDGDYHLQQPSKQPYPKSKNQSLTLSDDDEPGLTAENSADDGKRKMSPWQRMKWTDNMVRLLIMVVFYIGDEVGAEANDPASSKKKAGGVLQKKGKWKSVSRAMMERGFYVSPQQCEDKFNDLNKRYKRVNDILGKGTSCRVVENQNLLESMDLSPKMKEEVKKLLNSKHLFFREMCAYHNSCSHAGNGGAQPEAAAEPSSSSQLQQQQQQQQRCLHSTEKAQIMPNLNRGDNEGSKLVKGTTASGVDDDDDDEEDDDDDDEDEDEDDDEDGEEVIGGSGSRIHEDENERSSRKRPLIQELDGEILNVLRDGSKSPSEKRQWLKTKLMVLEEQRVGIQSQSLELEKQRLKWFKFSSKKEREMEREKLVNERVKLENERMVLLIRQKELHLIDHHHHHHSSNKKSDPSSITG
ncbi:sequence-specific DNA binding transcription factor [Perilla frutescens var. hirtella]|nr:sequence-specific DNA binding transcription factor [Perilla frutescens var. hirtella]